MDKNKVIEALQRIDDRAMKMEELAQASGPDVDLVVEYFADQDPGFDHQRDPRHQAAVESRCLRGNLGYGNANAVIDNCGSLLEHLQTPSRPE